MNKIWLLQKLKLFKDLSDETIREVDANSTMEFYKKGDSLYLGSSVKNHVYILKHGFIKITLLTNKGKEFIIEILKSGEIFGEIAEEDENRSILSYTENIESAVAMSNVEICKIDKNKFDLIMEKFPDIHLRITKIMGLRFKKITSKMTNLLYKDLNSRVAGTLIDLYEKFANDNNNGSCYIGIKLTHEEIAALVGASRQRITMILDKLKAEEMIDFNDRKIILKNIERLKNIAS